MLPEDTARQRWNFLIKVSSVLGITQKVADEEKMPKARNKSNKTYQKVSNIQLWVGDSSGWLSTQLRLSVHVTKAVAIILNELW